MYRQTKSSRTKAVQLRDFVIPEKYGIVVLCGYAVFSVHLGLWRCEFTNTIPDDSQSLNLSAADSRRLKHLNTFHKFSDDFCIQLLYVRVLTHKSNKAVYIHTALFLCGNSATKFYDASFQRFLLRLIVFGHLGKTLIRYLALNSILVYQAFMRILQDNFLCPPE